MHEELEKLRGGDRRSIGRAEEVAADVLADPSLFDVVFDGMACDDPVVRMRAADAVEKATGERPALLGDAHRERLLGDLAAVDQQEVRWHVAQLLPRLDLDGEDVDRAVGILDGYLDDESRIVRVNAMSALADLAVAHPGLREGVRARIEASMAEGSPAVRARGRKLLAALESED